MACPSSVASNPRKGLGGIHNGLRADKETFTGQMCRRVMGHLGGKQPVPTNKKYVIRVLNDDYVCVTPLRQQHRSQVLHQARRLVPTKRHTNQGVGGHKDSTSHPCTARSSPARATGTAVL